MQQLAIAFELVELALDRDLAPAVECAVDDAFDLVRDASFARRTAGALRDEKGPFVSAGANPAIQFRPIHAVPSMPSMRSKLVQSMPSLVVHSPPEWVRYTLTRRPRQAAHAVEVRVALLAIRALSERSAATTGRAVAAASSMVRSLVVSMRT